MLTQYHLKLHKKATSLLYGIERCDTLISNARAYLKRDKQLEYYLTKDFYVNQYHKYRSIKNRLLISYTNIIEKIAGPAMERSVTVFTTIVINENGVAETL